MNDHIRKRGGVWQLRKRVPKELWKSDKEEWVEESLRTGDVKEARVRRNRRLAELETLWEEQRRFGADRSELEIAYDAHVEEADRAKRTHLNRSINRSFAEHLIDELDEKALSWGRKNGYLADARSGRDFDEVRTMFVEQTVEGRGLDLRISAALGTIPISVAADRWLARTNLAPGTMREYRRYLRMAEEALPPINEITRDHAREYLQGIGQEMSRSAVNNARAALRGLWAHLGRDETIWAGFRIDVRKKSTQRNIYSDEDVQRLLAAAKSERLRFAILIALHTGARAKEISGLQYDETNDWLVISREHTKTEAGARFLPCPAKLRGVVKEWVARPYSVQSISNRFSTLKTELGFGREFVFHSFRHTLLSRLHEMDVQEATSALIAGHKHKEITYQVYGNKVQVEKLRPVMDRLDWVRLHPDPEFLARISEGATKDAPD